MNASNFQLPADGWHQIVAPGEWPITVQTMRGPKNIVQVVDAEGMQAMCNRFARQAQERNFPGLLVDFDHFSTDTEKSSAAAGWITELQNRSTGVFARVRWSADGLQAVNGGTYRLVSPTFSPKGLQSLGENRVRPVELVSVALTNDPNIKGMEPLTNRGQRAEAVNHFRRDAGAPPAVNNEAKQTKKQEPRMKNIATMLGLAAEASEEAILAQVTQLKNRADTAEKTVEPLKNRVASLETENQTLLAAQVDQDLERLKNRYLPEKRDAIKAQLLSNRNTTLAILEAMPDPKADVIGTVKAPLTNRATAGTPDNSAGGTKTDSLEIAVRDCQMKNRCSFQEAWDQVRREKPELFK